MKSIITYYKNLYFATMLILSEGLRMLFKTETFLYLKKYLL